MTTATWSTAPIPLWRIHVGDRVSLHGRLLPVTATVELAGEVLLTAEHGDSKVELAVDGSQTIDTHVPDEPVDGYDLWRPKQNTWVSGCICVHRRHPTLASNWEQISWDTGCPEHGIQYSYDD